MEKTLFEEISDAYPGMTNTQIRNTLAAFLGYGYTSEEMHKMGHSDNTAVTLLEITDGKVNIVYMNDNPHLSPARCRPAMARVRLLGSACQF